MFVVLDRAVYLLDTAGGTCGTEHIVRGDADEAIASLTGCSRGDHFEKASLPLSCGSASCPGRSRRVVCSGSQAHLRPGHRPAASRSGYPQACRQPPRQHAGHQPAAGLLPGRDLVRQREGPLHRRRRCAPWGSRTCTSSRCRSTPSTSSRRASRSATTRWSPRPSPARGPRPRAVSRRQVVYAHDGTAQDFDALQAAGVDVKGKLVLLDADLWTWWVNYQAAEATSRGAIGVIFTYGANTGALLLGRARRAGQLRRRVRLARRARPSTSRSRTAPGWRASSSPTASAPWSP